MIGKISKKVKRAKELEAANLLIDSTDVAIGKKIKKAASDQT